MAVRAAPANLLTVGQSTARFIPGSLVLHDRHTDSYGANTSRIVRHTDGAEDGNRRTWTWSGWVKKDANQTTKYQIFFSNGANSNGEGFIGFTGDDKLYFGNDGHHNFVTYDRMFRDNGWYHIVWAADTEQSSTNDRWKIYVNGELISASEYSSPGVSQYGEGYIQAYGEHGMDISIGDRERGHQASGNPAWPFSGNICECYFIDGEQLPAERFGYKDPLTETWRPKKFTPTATPNDGGTWSSTSDSPIDANFFDGSSKEAGTGKVLVVGSDTNWKTITDKSFTIHKSLELITSDGYHVRARLNGASGDIVATGNHTNGSTFGHVPNTGTFPFDISSLTLPYTVNGIEYIYGNGSGSMYIHGLKVDGVTLIDGNISNIGKHGFHLPLDGTKPIGEDQSGDGNDFTSYNLGNLSTLEHATGASPILNTINNGTIPSGGVLGSKLSENYVVTTASSKFVIDGVSQKSLTGLVRGATYTFDQSAGSNATHPLRLATVDKHTNTDWYSVDFDGTGDYFSGFGGSAILPTSTGTGFVVDYFWYSNGNASQKGLWEQHSSGSGRTAYFVNGTHAYLISEGNTVGQFKYHDNIWYFTRIIFDGTGNIYHYVDGNLIGSGTQTVGVDNTGFQIGAYGTDCFNGLISNFRIVVGANSLSGTEVPNTPLTNITNTTLLCCQESTITNAAVTPGAITSNGNPVSATKSPFIYEHGENGVLIEGTPGTSSYSGVDLDGAGDHLTVAQTSSQFSGQSDYTVECWVRFNSFVTDGAIWSNWNSGNNRSILLECNSSNNGFKFMINSGGSGAWTYINSSSVTVTPNKDQWYHLCQTYDHSATTTKCYIDGKFYGENTSTTPHNDSNANLHIGINQAASGSGTVDAQVTNFRWSNNVRYTEEFVPSRTPFASDGNTVFLGCLDGSSVTTAVTNTAGTISAVGDPQVYTVSDFYGPSTKITIPHNAPDTLYYYCQSHSGMGGTIGVVTGKVMDVDKHASHCVLALPFAGTHDDICPHINPVSTAQYVSPNADIVPTNLEASNLYGSQYKWDGDDVITIEDSPHLELGAKDFCIELWYYPTSLDASETILTKRANSGSYGGFLLNTSSSNITVNCSISGSSWDGFYSKTIGQIWTKKWHHIAVFRKGNDWYGAVDGVVKVIPANSSGSLKILNDTNHWYLGGESNGGYGINGYLQDFRMYIGTSKYTSKDFIVPSLQPSVLSESPSGVSLASLSQTKHTSNTPSGSVWFNGDKNFLRISDSNDFDLSNSSFTHECWIYFHEWDGTGFNTIVWVGSDASAANNCFVLDYKNQSDELRYIEAVSNTHAVYSASCSLALKRWYHLAWCRDGSKLRLFVDGIQVGITMNITSTVDGDDVPCYIGKRPGNDDRHFGGYISNLRLVIGTALYTKNFKVPLEPLTNITNTKLLCCQSNRESTAAAVSPNTIHVGGKEITTSGAANNTDDPFSNASLGCNDFDGSNDYMAVTANSDFDLGTGDWTIEGWFNPDTSGGYNVYQNGVEIAWTPNVELITNSNGTINWFVVKAGVSSNQGGNGTATYNNSAWNHIAMAKSGTTIKGYLNGTLDKTITGIDASVSSTTPSHWSPSVGARTNGSTTRSHNFFNGKISHIRVIKGRALYTGGSLTVPTSPIEPTSDTVLLCCTDKYQNNISYDSTEFNVRQESPFDKVISEAGTQETAYCTWNTLDRLSTNIDIQNGGLNWSCNNADGGNCRGTMHVSSGKWYWEVETQTATRFHCGVLRSHINLPAGDLGDGSNEWVYRTDGYKVHSGTEAQISADHSPVGNLIMIAYDADNREIYFGGNGAWFGASDPARRIDPAYTGMDPEGSMAPAIGRRTNNNAAYCNFGQKPFRYHPPEGFESLNYANINKNQKPEIVRPDQYFETVIWTGDGGSGKDVKVGFEPDFVWVKGRNHSQNHLWHDNVRGLNNYLKCDENEAQNKNNEFVKRTDADGIRIGSSGVVNDNSETNVAWCWKAGGINETTYNGSVSFDGSGDALTIADHADFEMASETNWTIEFWVKLNATPSGDWRVIVGKGLSSGNNYEWFFECFTDNTLKFLASDDGSAWPINQSFTDALTVGTWYHVAVVRNGTGADTLKGYLNGVQKWSITSLNLHTSGGGLGIGAHNNGGSLALESNTTVSNLRIVKGTSVYTSAFTPSTTPLAAISNTKLLCCKSGDSTVYDVSPGAISSSGGAHGDYTQSPFTKKKFQVDGVGYVTAAAAGLDGGTLNPTAASVGTKPGFAMLTYEGQSGNVTIAHGLRRVPKFIISKKYETADNWIVYHDELSVNQQMYTDLNNAVETNANIYHSRATDTMIPMGNWANGHNMISYVWAEVPGYSRMGKYKGVSASGVAGEARGPFVWCGFRPRFVLCKKTGAENWIIQDTVRDTSNPTSEWIYPDLAAQEESGSGRFMDFLSDGFKIRSGGTGLNDPGETYIFVAFAENPRMNLYGSQSNAH